MRKDLNKQLCERQRYGSERNFSQWRKMKIFNDTRGEELENLPARESMKVRYQMGWHEKDLNENLSPLYGLVRKSVGRKWDDFYSELCSVFNMKSVINKHILEHLYSYLEVNTYVDDDGMLMYRGMYRQSASSVLDQDGPEYYVDPTTKIITKNPHHESWRQRRNRQNREHKLQRQSGDYGPNRKVISETLEMRRKDEKGPWFVCILEQMDKHKMVKRSITLTDGAVIVVEEKRDVTVYDAWIKRKVDYWGKCIYNLSKIKAVNDHSKPGYYVKSIKTASKKELKEYLNGKSAEKE